MFRLFGFLVAGLTWVTAMAGSTLPDVTPERVASRTYVIHGPLGQPTPDNQAFINNPAFVITNAGVVVIDPGSSVQIGDSLLRKIAAITDKPVVAVLNTHIHGDHWLGNDAIQRAYPEAKIYAHPNMIAEVANGTGEQWVNMLMGLTDGAIAGTRVVGPTSALSNGDEIRVGEVRFKIHHTGHAHTLTDIMIEVPEEDLVFTGDNANNGRIARMDDGNFTGNVKALEVALDLNRKIYVPGHGKTGDKGLVQAYRRYLATLHATVSHYFEEGLSDFEIKDKAGAKLTEYADWVGFDSELGRHVSLAYLEVEAEAF